jgi:general secretion pathway protein J
MNRALRYRSQSGFTLLELLIAITLLSLLTTMLFAGLRLGTRHVERQSTRLERSAQIPAVQSFLRTQLANAQPLLLDQTSARKAILFDGRPDGLDFVGVAPESVTIGGLQLFSIEVNPGAASQLRVRWRLFGVPEVGVGRGAHETVLLDGVARLAFHYYGIVPLGKEPAWHQAWQEIEYLPSLIRLELVFQDGERMPALTVAARLSPLPNAK